MCCVDRLKRHLESGHSRGMISTQSQLQLTTHCRHLPFLNGHWNKTLNLYFVA